MVVLVAASLEQLQQSHYNRLRIQSPAPQSQHPKRLLVRAKIILPGSSSSSSSSSSSRLILPTNNNRGASDTFYQPYRPPPTNLESGISTEEQLQIVSERRGHWFQYGRHIPLLLRNGFTPASLDDATGLNGVEQNQIMVACQVRDALVSAGLSDESLDFFNMNPGVLYELRILSAQQRVICAEYVIENKLDAKAARDAARALKDFARRKRDFGWDFFSPDTGDCLAYWWYRQSREFKDDGEVRDALEKALRFATSERSREFVRDRLGKCSSPDLSGGASAGSVEKRSAAELTRVVRLHLGETSGLVMLPVADPDADSIREAPVGSAVGDGAFRIHRSGHGWKAWVPLPGWKPILEAVAPVTVLFPDRKQLDLHERHKQPAEEDEELLLVVDKGKVDRTSQESDTSVFLVASGEKGLQLENSASKSQGEVLGKVLLALAPPGSDTPEEEVDMD